MSRLLAISLCLCGLLFAGLFYQATAAAGPDAGWTDPSMSRGPLPAAAVVAPLTVISPSSSAWSPPPWLVTACWISALAIAVWLLKALLAWIPTNAYLKRNAAGSAVLERIAEAALVVVQGLQQVKPVTGATGAELRAQAIASVKDQLTGEKGAEVAAKILGVTPERLDAIIASHVEASVLKVKAAEGKPLAAIGMFAAPAPLPDPPKAAG